MNAESVKLFVLQNYNPMTTKSILSNLFVTSVLMIVSFIIVEYHVEFLSLFWLISFLYIGHTIWGVYLVSGEERRTIKAKYLFEGTWFSLFSIFLLLLALVVLSAADVSALGYSVLLLFLAVGVAMFIVGIIKMSNRKIAKINNENISNNGNLIAISGTSFVFLGTGISRTLFSRSPELAEIVVFIAIVIMILIFVNIGIMCCYKFYLIQKYCPEIQEEVKQNNRRKHRQI